MKLKYAGLTITLCGSIISLLVFLVISSSSTIDDPLALFSIKYLEDRWFIISNYSSLFYIVLQLFNISFCFLLFRYPQIRILLCSVLLIFSTMVSLFLLLTVGNGCLFLFCFPFVITQVVGSILSLFPIKIKEKND